MIKKTLLFSRFLWHLKHEAVHVIIGLTWFQFVRSTLSDIPFWYAIAAIIASLLPDIEHIHYLFMSNMKNNLYSIKVKKLLRERKFIQLFQLVEVTHKKDVFLRFHHIGVVAIFLLLAFWAFSQEHQFLTVMYGAIASHYLFDIIDDIIYLKRLNPNWISGIQKRHATLEE